MLWEDLGFPESTPVKDEDIYYIYRIPTGSYHGSQWNPETNASENAAKYVEEKLKYSKIPLGDVVLNPHWSVDWTQLTKDACK